MSGRPRQASRRHRICYHRPIQNFTHPGCVFPELLGRCLSCRASSPSTCVHFIVEHSILAQHPWERTREHCGAHHHGSHFLLVPCVFSFHMRSLYCRAQQPGAASLGNIQEITIGHSILVQHPWERTRDTVEHSNLVHISLQHAMRHCRAQQ